MNRLNNVLNVHKDALSSDHVADSKDDVVSLFELGLQLLLIDNILVVESITQCLFGLPRKVFALEQHFLLNTNHGLRIGVAGVVLETYLETHTLLQACAFDQVFKVRFVLLSNVRLVFDCSSQVIQFAANPEWLRCMLELPFLLSPDLDPGQFIFNFLLLLTESLPWGVFVRDT